MGRPRSLPASLAVMAVLLVLAGCAQESPPELPDGVAVLAEARGDLDGDGRDEIVRLTGRSAAGSPFTEDLALVVGSAPRRWPLPDAAASGYAPVLQLVDLTGDGRQEILVTADTGGSGGLVGAAAIAAEHGEQAWSFRTIYDARSGVRPRLAGSLADGFIAQLEIEVPGLDPRQEELDLSANREFYLQTGVYDAQGELLKEVAIWGDALTAVAPLSPAAGGPGLQITQQPRGAANADRLAEIRTLLVWQDGRWRAKELLILPAH